ncbi:unnamed protein product [Thlaspi arvense]|uniref:Uncharacterized protein n=1 Tax=Thlaspi arvense TaxID=13288 RepID=A0AAU9SPT5_THLAR|nr:unnamed protein product [Thlaspi arvense]
MNGKEDFQMENTKETEKSSADTGVSLLDSNDTCLVNLSEKMHCYDELSQGNKRKERATADIVKHREKDHGSDLEDQKMPTLICADDLQNKTLEAIPNMEEANKEKKEPAEIKKAGEGSHKEKPGLVCTDEELEKWSTQPVTNLDAFVEYEFEERDFKPLESVGECEGYYNEVPLSPQESSNMVVVGQLQVQRTDITLDEEVMQEDGMSLSDLESDLHEEGQGCTSDLDKDPNQELFDDILSDLAKELKP